MRTLLMAVGMFAVGGCVSTQGVVPLASMTAQQRLKIVDQRPQNEKSGPFSCRNIGFFWSPVNDTSFSMPRVELLRAQLDAAAGDKISEVHLEHFQTCYLVRAGAMAGVAGVSVAAAVIANSIAVGDGDDVILSYVELNVDGRRFSGSAVRPFKAGIVMQIAFEKPETAQLMGQTTEEAIRDVVANVVSGRTITEKPQQ